MMHRKSPPFENILYLIENHGQTNISKGRRGKALRGLAGQNHSIFEQNEHFEIFRFFKSTFNFLSNDI